MLLVDKLIQKDNFSKSEMIIADYIINLGEDIKDVSARKIARETYTSPGTVLNLCEKVGVKGFDHFKSAYLKEIQYLDQQFGTVDPNIPFHENDTFFIIANKMGTLYEETIKDTLSLLQHDSLQKAVLTLSKAQNIHIYSFGTALNIAESFKEKMMKIGKNVYITNNLNYQRYEMNCITNRDCVIFISYSGETGNIIDMAQTCIIKKIPFISMTSFGENTLSQMSDINLFISTRERLTHNIANFNSNLSIFFLLDILYATYFSLNYMDNLEYKMNVTHKFENKRSSTNPILIDNTHKK